MDGWLRNIFVAIFWLSFFATCYTYLFYPLLLMLLQRLFRLAPNRRSSPVVSGDHVLPTVTMVISAYNEQSVLPAKLANCRDLDYPAEKIRFLIGSDGSDDGTAAILDSIEDDSFTAVHCRQRRGKVGMLNYLIARVETDIVVFSDANTMYHRSAVLELVSRFVDPKVGCVIGKLELSTAGSDPNACEPEGLYWRYENRLKRMESDLGIVPTINGGIFAIRRELYERLPANAVTEDQVLGMKIMVGGHRCVFADGARAFERISDWSGELRRRIRISAGNFQSLFLVPGILHPRCGWVSFAFFSHKLLRWLVPLFLVGMLLSNLLLAGRIFYGGTMAFQVLFYAIGLIGAILPKLSGMLKILAIPKYFIAMNFAILVGLARFLLGRQRVTWAKAKR